MSARGRASDVLRRLKERKAQGSETPTQSPVHSSQFFGGKPNDEQSSAVNSSAISQTGQVPTPPPQPTTFTPPPSVKTTTQQVTLPAELVSPGSVGSEHPQRSATAHELQMELLATQAERDTAQSELFEARSQLQAALERSALAEHDLQSASQRLAAFEAQVAQLQLDLAEKTAQLQQFSTTSGLMDVDRVIAQRRELLSDLDRQLAERELLLEQRAVSLSQLADALFAEQEQRVRDREQHLQAMETALAAALDERLAALQQLTQQTDSAHTETWTAVRAQQEQFLSVLRERTQQIASERDQLEREIVSRIRAGVDDAAAAFATKSSLLQQGVEAAIQDAMSRVSSEAAERLDEVTATAARAAQAEQEQRILTARLRTVQSELAAAQEQLHKQRSEVAEEFKQLITEKDDRLAMLERQLSTEQEAMRHELARELETQFRAKYEEIEKDLRAQIQVAHAEKLEAVLKERQAVEQKIRLELEQQFLAHKEEMQLSFNSATDALTRHFKELEQSHMTEYDRRMQVLTQRQLELESETLSLRASVEQQAQDRAARFIAEAQQRADAAIADTQTAAEKLRSQLESDYERRLQAAEQNAQRATELSIAQSQQHNEQILNEERKQHQQLVATLQAQHQRELEMAAAARAQSVTELQTHGDQLLKQLEDAQLRVSALESEIAKLQAGHQTELATVEQSTSDRARQEFADSLHMIKEDLSLAARQRQESALQEVRAHFEAIVLAKQEEINSALELKSSIEEEEKQRWQQLLYGIDQTHTSLLEKYETAIRSKYDEYVHLWEERLTAETQRMEQLVLKELQQRQEQETQARTTIRKVRMAAFRWKLDHERQMSETMQQQLSTMEAQYKRTLEAETAESAAALAKVNVELAVWQEKSAKFSEQIAALQDELRRRDQEQQLSLQRERENNERKEQLLTALQKLWDALETPHGEIASFAMACLHMAGATSECVQQLRHEGEKLHASLPVAQAAARREFVLQRLSALSRRSTEALQRIYLADAALLQREDAERHELVTELLALDEHLRQRISEQEQLFNYRFTWKGVALADVMASQTESALTAVAAPAPLHGSPGKREVSKRVSVKPLQDKSSPGFVDARLRSPARIATLPHRAQQPLPQQLQPPHQQHPAAARRSSLPSADGSSHGPGETENTADAQQEELFSALLAQLQNHFPTSTTSTTNGTL